MAWIIGLFTDDELKQLRARGWEDCDPPVEMISEDELRGVCDMQTRAFFVDRDVVAVMSGPDWETQTDPWAEFVETSEDEDAEQ